MATSAVSCFLDNYRDYFKCGKELKKVKEGFRAQKHTWSPLAFLETVYWEIESNMVACDLVSRENKSRVFIRLSKQIVPQVLSKICTDALERSSVNLDGEPHVVDGPMPQPKFFEQSRLREIEF